MKTLTASLFAVAAFASLGACSSTGSGTANTSANTSDVSINETDFAPDSNLGAIDEPANVATSDNLVGNDTGADATGNTGAATNSL